MRSCDDDLSPPRLIYFSVVGKIFETKLQLYRHKKIHPRITPWIKIDQDDRLVNCQRNNIYYATSKANLKESGDWKQVRVQCRRKGPHLFLKRSQAVLLESQPPERTVSDLSENSQFASQNSGAWGKIE